MPRALSRPGDGGRALAALLTADRFRLGPKTARVAQNLATFGGADDERAAAWVGADLPPLGAPSVTLGASRGTLGPHSFGFLDNRRGVAPYAAALPARPPTGGLAIVCGRREALPEVAPLAAARGLGVAWIVSVGDGDAGELLAFLGADAGTSAVLLAAAARPESVAALAGKPLVVLGGDPLLRAAARRAGGVAVDALDDWLAHGALLGAGVARPRHIVALVAGGGAAVLAEAARDAGLALDLRPVDDGDPDEAADAVAAADADLVLLAGDLPSPARPSLRVDLGRAEEVRALARALARAAAAPEPPIPRVRADRDYAARVLAEAGAALADHDAKRMLKAYGVAVSRQAPAASATAAARVAAQIGYPVDVASDGAVRRAASAAELRRVVAVALSGGLPFVLVRQAFPESPRARLAIRRVRGLGLVAEVARERALLPLERPDAIVLARAASADAPRALVDLLARASACAVENDLTFDLELYVGDEPAVVAAKANR